MQDRRMISYLHTKNRPRHMDCSHSNIDNAKQNNVQVSRSQQSNNSIETTDLPLNPIINYNTAMIPKTTASNPPPSFTSLYEPTAPLEGADVEDVVEALDSVLLAEVLAFDALAEVDAEADLDADVDLVAVLIDDAEDAETEAEVVEATVADEALSEEALIDALDIDATVFLESMTNWGE